MSDEEKEIDVESDYEDGENRNEDSPGQQFASLEEKRAHHNALERKRRDHIKDSFVGLRDSIPTLEGDGLYPYSLLNRQLDFSSELGVANEILKNEPTSSA